MIDRCLGSHLLQDCQKEPNLNLCGLLQQRVQRRRPFSLSQYSKPLFDSAQFLLHVQRRTRHLLQRGLIILQLPFPFI